jgi:hypothetical protein
MEKKRRERQKVKRREEKETMQVQKNSSICFLLRHMMNYWTGAAPNPVPLPIYDPSSDQLLVLDLTIQPVSEEGLSTCS